jgi:hypothetical protein
VAEIKKRVERFSMSFWMTTPWGNVASAREAIRLREDCGTTGCLAGWIVMTTPEEVVADIMERTERTGIGSTASIIAGLDYNQSNKLFYLGGWPEEFQLEYTPARDRGDSASMAAALERRVEHFIRTGE